mgnify:CR=1 FL=1
MSASEKPNDFYFESRMRARREAHDLMWKNVEKSIWWNEFENFNQIEKDLEKIRIQYDHYFSTLVSFRTSFVPTVLELKDDGIKTVLQFGAGRRLNSICEAANVFTEIAYPERTKVATEEDMQKIKTRKEIE